MEVGVPKEIKANEHRVGLTPAAVREYVAHGHTVRVETGAGDGSLASDADYIEAGARIVATAAELFAQCELIIKVKEPQALERAQLREGQILYAYLHLAPDTAQTEALLDSGVTAIAYETVTDANGGLPLLAPMSEVAGRLSIQAAASCLEKHRGGSGTLLGGVPGVPPGRVVVLGGGVAGTNAARMAVGLGAEVTIIDRSLPRLQALDEMFGSRVRTVYSTTAAIEAEVAGADVVIGAVLIPGAAAPKLVTRAMLGSMKPGSVLVDIAIDQGGCFETSTPTTHMRPSFIVDGVVHYCVANMPGAVPRTSSAALNNATLRHGLALADRGLAALADAHLLAGLSTHRGALTNAAVADHQGIVYVDPASLGLAD